MLLEVALARMGELEECGEACVFAADGAVSGLLMRRLGPAAATTPFGAFGMGAAVAAVLEAGSSRSTCRAGMIARPGTIGAVGPPAEHRTMAAALFRDRWGPCAAGCRGRPFHPRIRSCARPRLSATGPWRRAERSGRPRAVDWRSPAGCSRSPAALPVKAAEWSRDHWARCVAQ